MPKPKPGDRVRLRGDYQEVATVERVDGSDGRVIAYVRYGDGAPLTADLEEFVLVEQANYAAPDVLFLAITPAVESRLREALKSDSDAALAYQVIEAEARDQMARRG